MRNDPSPGTEVSPSRSRSGFDAFLTNGVILGLGLFSTLAVARGLGPAGKGRYDLLVAAGSMLALFLGLQLSVGVTYMVARGGDGRPLRLRMALFAVSEGALAVALLWALWIWFGPPWPADALGVPPLSPLVAGGLIVAFVVASSVASLWRAILIGRQEIIRANRRDLAIRVLQVGLVVAVVVAGAAAGRRASPEAVFAGTVVAAIIAARVYVLGARVPEATSPALDASHRVEVAMPSRTAFRRALSFSLPAYLSNIVQMANYRLDLFFVAFFAGAAQVGVYAIAVVLAQLVWLAPQAVATVLLPSTAADQQDLQGNSERASLGARVSLWGGLGVGLVLAAVSGWVIPEVFGRSFAGSSSLLLWLLPGVCLFAPATVFASFIAGMGRPKLNLLVSGVGFVATICLDLLLIPVRGAQGAAIASSVSYSISAVVMAAIFLKVSTAGLSDIVLLRAEDVRAVVGAARAAMIRGEVIA